MGAHGTLRRNAHARATPCAIRRATSTVTGTATQQQLASPSLETLEDAERLNPIRALLLGLDRLRAVTVITATVSLQSRFDLEKIARFVELLPDLEGDKVATLLGRFRKGVRQKYNDVQLPGGDVVLDELENGQVRQMRHAVLGSRLVDICDALPLLCATPRGLKQALRLVREDWDRLHGEIDFDDFFVATVLRVALPDVFSLIQRHINLLQSRASTTDWREKERREELKKYKAEFDAIPLDGQIRAAADLAVSFLFSDAPGRERKPQGIATISKSNYWHRLLSRPELLETERDQPVLKKLVGSPTDDVLFAMLEDEGSGKIEEFAFLIPAERVIGLLVPFIKRHVLDNVAQWSELHPRGFIPLWRMVLDRVEAQELGGPPDVKRIQEAISVCIPGNLLLAAQLEHYFVLSETRSKNIFTDEERMMLKSHLRSVLVARLKAYPALLVQGLRGSPASTLLWLAWGLDRIRAKTTTGTPFANWSELAPTVLEALDLNFEVMGPQVASLVTTSDGMSIGGVQRCSFDAAMTTTLFGSVEKVLQRFESTHAVSQDLSVESMYHAIRVESEARRTLTKTL